jgi:hypothetical protein
LVRSDLAQSHYPRSEPEGPLDASLVVGALRLALQQGLDGFGSALGGAPEVVLLGGSLGSDHS